MKKFTIFTLLMGILVGTVFSYAQEGPRNPNAGRIVVPEEVMRITDEHPGVILRGPKNIKCAKNGDIYFGDYPSLYRFSNRGKFLAQLVKTGEGPQECSGAMDFIIDNDFIRIYSLIPSKILDFDLDGKFIRERKLNLTHRFYFLDHIEGKTYGICDRTMEAASHIKEGELVAPFVLYEFSEGFNKLIKKIEFPVQSYKAKRSWFRQSPFWSITDGRFIYVVHTSEYAITKYDPLTGKVERVIKRDYPRIKSGVRGKVEIKDRFMRRGVKIPALKYKWDISGIAFFKDTLWVVTSTKRDNNQTLIDVFDKDGKYLDNFYLQMPPDVTYFTLYKYFFNYILSIETDNDGDYRIVKYRIMDSDLSKVN